MFIFLISALTRPYLASKSSSKMASSNVLEHSRPMLRAKRRATLPGLADAHHRRHRRLAAHADQADLLRPRPDRLGVGHGVGAVGVAAAGRGQDLLLGAGHAGDRLPRRAVALEVGDEGGVDVAVLHGPDEDGGHEAAVLAQLVDRVVGRPGEDHVLRDALHLDGGAGPAEQELVDLRLPGPEAGAGPGARRATPLAVAAAAPVRAPLRGGTACRRPRCPCSRGRHGGRPRRSRRSRCTARS